jgi:hypothetical protein
VAVKTPQAPARRGAGVASHAEAVADAPSVGADQQRIRALTDESRQQLGVTLESGVSTAAPLTRPVLSVNNFRAADRSKIRPPVDSICFCHAVKRLGMSTRTAEPNPIWPSQRSLTDTPVARTRSTAGQNPSVKAWPRAGSPPGTTRRRVSKSGAVQTIPADIAADPPGRVLFSTTVTPAPAWAAVAAAARPAIPPPMTSRFVLAAALLVNAPLPTLSPERGEGDHAKRAHRTLEPFNFVDRKCKYL